MNKFKINEIVAFISCDAVKIGTIQDVFKENYSVKFGTDDSLEYVHESQLRKIENSDAFNIIQIVDDTSDINKCPARELAAEILGQVELYGVFYYEIEDWLTNCLQGEIHDLPQGIDIEYLKCALRVQIRDFFDGFEYEDVENEEIETVVDNCLYNSSENVLNIKFIRSEVKKYLEENYR